MFGRLLLLAALVPLLGACNMAVSETPVFAENDAATLGPRTGIWVGDDPECPFDSALPEAQWPSCAAWLVVKSSDDFLMRDGKETQHARFMIAKGQPPIVQVLWRDEAKEDGKTFYVFFGIEPGLAQADGKFSSAFTWAVKCGAKDPSSSEIKPYAGISPECRPSSPDAIRSAAVTSRQPPKCR